MPCTRRRAARPARTAPPGARPAPFKRARTARSGRRTAPPVRRTWAVAGAAVSVAAVVLGVAVFGGTQRPGVVDGAVGAQSATAATAGTSVAAGPRPKPAATQRQPHPYRRCCCHPGTIRPGARRRSPAGAFARSRDTEQQLLRPGVGAATAVVCDTTEKERPGDGVWLMAGERELTAAQATALAAALTVADVPADPAGVCDAMGVLVPDFALVLADGRTVRPGVPGDGCHPSRDVAAILAPTGGSPVPMTTPIEQLRSQAMVDTGCDPASTPYCGPVLVGGNGFAGSRPKPPVSASVCRYSVAGDSPESCAPLWSRWAPRAEGAGGRAPVR